MDWAQVCSAMVVVVVAVAALTVQRADAADEPPPPPQPVQVSQCSVRSRTDECRDSQADWSAFDKCCDAQCVGMRRMYPKPRIYSPVIGAANNSLMFCLCCSDDVIDHEHGYFGFWSSVILSLVTVVLTTAACYFPMNDWAVVTTPTPI